MNTGVNQNMIEINIVQFFKRLLVQWRAIVAVGLIFGVVAMLGKYALDLKNYNITTSGVAEESAEVEITLSDEEMSQVMTAVHRYDQIQGMKELLSDNPYMNLSGKDCLCLNLCYLVTVAEADKVDEAIVVYQNKLADETVLRGIGEAIGLDVKPAYIKQLLSITGEGEIMELSFMLCDGVDEQKLRDALMSAVDEAVDSDTTFSGRVELVSDSIGTYDAYSIYSVVNSHENNVVNFTNRLNSTVESMNSNQKQLYDQLTSGVSEEEPAIVIPVKPSMDLIVLLIGIFAGAFVYIFVYFACVIFGKDVYDPEVEKLTVLPRVAVLIVPGKHSWTRFFTCDSILYRLLFNDMTEMRKPNNIVARIQNVAGGEFNRSFQILQPGFDMEGESEMNALLDAAKNAEVRLDVKTCDMSNTKDVVSKLDASIPAIIAIRAKQTKKKDVRNLYEMLKNQNVKTIGELHIEEV